MSKTRKPRRSGPNKSHGSGWDSQPDIRMWQPREGGADGLLRSFHQRCLYAEKRLQLKRAEEEEYALDNYDPGIGVEGVFRHELSQLLPRRYNVTSGVVVDRKGRTSGQCDVVIFNDTWFPLVKAPAANDSLRCHLPVEGAYAVVEVKKTLTRDTLDLAMKKLVTTSRLFRPAIPRDRVVENREIGHCTHFISNPLYTAVLALDTSVSDYDRLIRRFIEINKLLPRHEMVNALICLTRGCVLWGFRQDDEMRPAGFSGEDLIKEIRPVYLTAEPGRSSLYPFVQSISSHLYHSVLGAEDIAAVYGFDYELGPPGIQWPADPELWVSPDSETLDYFDEPCSRSEQFDQ